MITTPQVLPVIYIAGPYRAATPRRVVANIWRALDVALTVWKLGGVALCPHSNCFLLDGEAHDDIWIQGDLELLRRSDAMLLMVGWEMSEGAKQEHQLAIEWGIPVFYETGSGVLKGWIADWKRTARVE